ncbi:G-protein coupled receptor dmsr-1-like isoform X2 [Tigriopus californicus]|uniref:G-protein coupled receptor dmsr-1-like isoform X2 n=1 Tax=Tigriopus californicus TaxID=6832 RepID=UPI0027D9D76D|nr:G-protein coupled receptor dmsr-1-like isoform X2 [Tigriopus californicus]
MLDAQIHYLLTHQKRYKTKKMNVSAEEFQLIYPNQTLLTTVASSEDLNTTTTTTIAVAKMCDLEHFAQGYKDIHGYLSLVVCLFGTIANILNIVVLTRKEMNGSPINRILTGIAVADMLVMVEYIPFTIHMHLWTNGREPEEQYSWNWAALLWFHVNFSIVIHAVSIFLTLTLAVWRFIMIRFHTLAPIYCTMERCKIVILCAYVFPFFLTIPNYLAMTIKTNVPKGTNATKYYVNWSEMANANDKLLYRANIWLYSFILKLVPCIVLTLITGFLIRVLYKAEERSARLKNGGSHAPAAANYRRPSEMPPSAAAKHDPHGSVRLPNGYRGGAPTKGPSAATSNRKRSIDRTTRLLIAILVLFLATEFPQGILGMLSAVHGVQYFHDCYIPLGDVWDAMALINSAINFILYCIMSKQFRRTFVETFHLEWCAKLDCPTVTVQSNCPRRKRASSRRDLTFANKAIKEEEEDLGEQEEGGVQLLPRTDHLQPPASSTIAPAQSAQNDDVKIKMNEIVKEETTTNAKPVCETDPTKKSNLRENNSTTTTKC